jgi:hypothetical protein
LTPRLISRRSKLRFSAIIGGSRPKRADMGTHDPRIFDRREESVNKNFPHRSKQHCPGYDSSPGRGSCGSVAHRARCASGSGRTRNCTAMGMRPLPPSTRHGARSPLDTHNHRLMHHAGSAVPQAEQLDLPRDFAWARRQERLCLPYAPRNVGKRPN